MAPLDRQHVDELLDACGQYARDRRQLTVVAGTLTEALGPVRDALNQIAKLIAGGRASRVR